MVHLSKLLIKHLICVKVNIHFFTIMDTEIQNKLIFELVNS